MPRFKIFVPCAKNFPSYVTVSIHCANVKKVVFLSHSCKAVMITNIIPRPNFRSERLL